MAIKIRAGGVRMIYVGFAIADAFSPREPREFIRVLPDGFIRIKGFVWK